MLTLQHKEYDDQLLSKISDRFQQINRKSQNSKGSSSTSLHISNHESTNQHQLSDTQKTPSSQCLSGNAINQIHNLLQRSVQSQITPQLALSSTENQKTSPPQIELPRQASTPTAKKFQGNRNQRGGHGITQWISKDSPHLSITSNTP